MWLVVVVALLVLAIALVVLLTTFGSPDKGSPTCPTPAMGQEAPCF